MTADDFRKIALSCPEAVESAHMSHPDFRVRGKIFATLGYPDQEWATLKLTPAEQSEFIEADPDQPANDCGGGENDRKLGVVGHLHPIDFVGLTVGFVCGR